MALYTYDQLAGVAAVLVANELKLIPTVDRSFEGDFVAGGGSTVFVRVPSAAVSRDRDLDDVTTSVVFDTLSETAVPITLDTHAHSGVVLSEEDNLLNLMDFSRQVLAPQTDAVADRCERAVADVLNAATVNTTIPWDAAKPSALFTALRRELRTRGVDFGDNEETYVVAGGNVVDVLLDSGALDFAQTGDADALRNGAVGKLRGFTVIESSRIDADEAIAYPKHAVHLAIRPPAIPVGANSAAIAKDKSGLVALRVLRDYDSAKTADRSLVSTFVGAKAMPAYRITRNYTAGSESATRTEVAGGHIVRVSISDTEPGA